MEAILDVYHGMYDEKHPLICMDESSKQLLADIREPVPVEPGQVARYDSEYQRKGTQNVFLACAPLQGWRDVSITDQRTKHDWAHYMKTLVDVHFPSAERITVVLDNLNTHTLASLYATFEPAEARRIARKLDLHYTPKHGSWLNMAEIELSVLSRQCLNRRIADADTLKREATAWVATRNALATTVDWRFTTEDARTKLKRLYPQV
jgi:transposase